VPELPRTQEKDYVSVSEFSTMQCKFWNLEHGWEELVSEIKSMDLQVMSVSKEKTRLKKVRRCNDKSMEETIRNIYYSKAFIGVGSGLSWLAWALGKPVVLVSGFSEAFCEFSESASVSRVLSTEVCHGCFNDVECYFDRGDWDWCPREADFVCSKNITVSQVLTGLRRVLK
jgi:autotransporter strand-loop-strand O-heptosyltransferase